SLRIGRAAATDRRRRRRGIAAAPACRINHAEALEQSAPRSLCAAGATLQGRTPAIALASLPRPASTGNIQRYLLAREVFSAPMSADTDTRLIGEGQMAEDYARFSRLLIDRPHPRVLRVVMNRPDKLNATDGAMHSDLTHILRVTYPHPTL